MFVGKTFRVPPDPDAILCIDIINRSCLTSSRAVLSRVSFVPEKDPAEQTPIYLHSPISGRVATGINHSIFRWEILGRVRPQLVTWTDRTIQQGHSLSTHLHQIVLPPLVLI